MDTQGMPPRMETLDDLKQAISLASAKVSILKDDEVKLTYMKSDVEKEIARLEMKRDSIIAEVTKLEESKATTESALLVLEAKFVETQAAFGVLDEELAVARRAMEEAQTITVLEATKLSTLVVQAREVQIDLDARVDAVQAKEEALEQRIAQVQSALGLV